jgi:hypothetical protein
LQPIAPAPPVPQAAALRDRVQQRPGESAAASERPGTGQPAFVPEVPRVPEALRKSEGAAPAPAAAAPAASPRPDSSPGIQSGISGAIGIRGTELSANTEARERTPEKWLEDIRKLKTDGKTTEAERELAEFKKRYPDYILPEELR